MGKIIYGVASYGDLDEVLRCKSYTHAVAMVDRTYGDKVAVNTGSGWKLEN